MLYIHNATILTPHRQIDNGALLTDGSTIVAVGSPGKQIFCPPEAKKIDATGLYLTPGFIDLQCNGAFGHDFTVEPAAIWPVAAKLPRYGVTSFLPTIVTSPLETIARAQAVVVKEKPTDFVGALPLGLHLEGPFLNVEKKGAHNPVYLRWPTLEAITNWTLANGVRLVTLAPELLGATEVITTLVERGIIVSAGHSLATFSEAQAGFEAGIRYGTHLFNAMSPLHHRKPGLIGALLADERVIVGLIADGVHVHPLLVKMVWQMLGPARLNLITDAMAALGKPPGHYQVNNFEAIVDETSARLADGTLAGSILSMDVALRNLMTITGCPLTDALATITTTPIRLLGITSQRGELTPGTAADLVILSRDLEVVMTVVEGDIVYQANCNYSASHVIPSDSEESL